ncbi:translation initiation factor 2 [uncultured Methylobacterium sp.]|uniref:translation initiation factor 2 n=1 Tax=uncultured Methylobacterium sp. TaxID=157278 RepID=UPI0035CC04BF
MRAKRVADDAKGAGGEAKTTGSAAAGKATGSAAAGRPATDGAEAGARPAGPGAGSTGAGTPPRVTPAAAPARGPGFGSVAAAGLLGGVIGAGLLFAIERAGVLGNTGDEARINALDQRVSGQVSGLDQRLATLSPRDAVAALDRRVAASEAALKPLPDAVKAAEAAAKQALDRANAAPAPTIAAPAEGQAASSPSALPADLAARLDGLDQRVSALQEEPGREQPAESRLGVVQAGDGAKEAAKEAVRQASALDERVKALEGKMNAEGTAAPADLAPKLAALQGEVEARTKANGEADQALGQRLDALQKALDERVKAATESVQTATQAARDAAEAGKTQAQEATSALDRRLQDQSGRIAALDKAVALRAEASAVQAALKVVTVDRVVGALDAGRAYAEPLASLRRLETGDASRVDALAPFAEAGAPTAAQLAADFQLIAEKIAAVRRAADAREVAASGDLKRRFLSMTESIVQVRKVDAPAAPEASEADPVAKVRGALDRGAIREAAQAYAEMPQEAQALGGGFGATLRSRAKAAQAAEALLSDAFKGLPTPAPAPGR